MRKPFAEMMQRGRRCLESGAGKRVAWVLDVFETKLEANSQHDHLPSAAALAAGPHVRPVYVAYDISDRRRRHCLRRLLLGFGDPVQESVFLCWLDAARQQRFDRLLETFRRLPHIGEERIECIRASTDSVRPVAKEWVIE